MTEQEQRIAIHEARGLCPHTETEYYTCQGDSGFTCKKCGEDLFGNRMPDYPSDLNAITEARRAIFATRPGFYDRSYISELVDVLDGDRFDGMLDKRMAYCLIDATANQHCRALLRTIGKWKDTPALTPR